MKEINMNIFLKKYIVTDIDVDNQDQALLEISKLAKKLNISSDSDDVYKALVARENESTTGFKDGFCIPHARTESITKPAVLFVSFKNGVDWKSLDNKLTKYAFVILIPIKFSNMHMDVLTKISLALLDESFIKSIQETDSHDEIYKLISNFLVAEKEVNESQNNENADHKIVGVSACATGVVHTYMAKEALEIAGNKLNIQVKIETQGQKGQEFTLTEEDIKNADAVIIAADINIELDRFVGKKIIKMKTNDAIDNPESALKAALDSKEVHSANGNSNSKTFAKSQTKFGIFMQHMLSGVSRMIPFIVFSGIVWGIINSIADTNKELAATEAFKIAKMISEVGFTFFIAIMGGYIADSIAGRAAFAPGMIGTFVAASPSFYFWWTNVAGPNTGIPHAVAGSPFLGSIEADVSLSLFAALIMGFAAGYLVKFINSWKVPKIISPLIPILFIPIVATSVLAFPFIFLLSGPLGYIMNGFAYGLGYLGKIQGVNFLIGFVLGAMIGFDMGGPINKIAGTAATSLITIDARLMGAVATAIPIAPLACGLSAVIFRKLFDENERSLGVSALSLGFFGISEGAIPFAVKRPKETLIANVVGSAVAGGLAFAFFVGGYVGMWGGPITAFVLGVKSPATITNIPVIFGGTGNLQYLAILWFFVAMAGGCVVHMMLYLLLISRMSGFKDGEKMKFKKIFEKNKKVNNPSESSKNELGNYFSSILNNNYYLNKMNFLFR